MARLLFLQNIDYEFLGPMYVSSMVKGAGHDCRLLIGQTLDDFENGIEQFNPDLVGFSIMSGSHHWAVDLAQKIKQEYEVFTILGGAHPTFFPEVIERSGIDMVLRGEGEDAAVDLLHRIDRRLPLT